MDDERLISVRCPAMVYDKKNDKLIKCNKLCVRVFPGSSGEIQCRGCKRRFRFYVDSQAKSILSVKAKEIK
jgi:hypothetical protein